MALSDDFIRINRTIFINKQVRRYYGKKYYRSAQSDPGSGAQTRLAISQARAKQSRLSESTVGIATGKEDQVVTDLQIIN